MTLYEESPGYFYDDSHKKWSLFKENNGQWRLEDLANNTRSDHPSFGAAVSALKSHVGDVKVHYKQAADSSPQDRREHIKWALVGARAFSKALKKHNETGDPGSILEAFKHAYGVEINLKDAGLEEFAQMWEQARTHLKQDIVRTMTPTKKALVRLANESPEFGKALVAEINKQAGGSLRDSLQDSFHRGRVQGQYRYEQPDPREFKRAMQEATKYFAKMQKVKNWFGPLGTPTGYWTRLENALEDAAHEAGVIHGAEEAASKFAADKQADKWKTKPKGWTDESRKKFWDSLTSAAPKHKVSECIKRMNKHMDGNAGAFCASLADRVMPGWRQEAAKDRAKKARFESPTAQSLMADLKRVPGVKDVYETDVWKDGYYHFRVVLKTDGTIPVQVHANRGHRDLFQIKDLKRTLMAIRRVLKKADISIDNIEIPKRVYEYQDRYDQARRNPRASGFEDNEVKVEFYVVDQTRMASFLTQPLSLRRDYGAGSEVDEWLDIDEVRQHCPPCADKMAANNIRKVKASTLRVAMQRR